MDHQLTPTQAFWLGHLYHAHGLGQSLSDYAQRQGVSLADLMRWERRLVVQHITVPERHRPARFLAVAVSS